MHLILFIFCKIDQFFLTSGYSVFIYYLSVLWSETSILMSCTFSLEILVLTEGKVYLCLESQIIFCSSLFSGVQNQSIYVKISLTPFPENKNCSELIYNQETLADKIVNLISEFATFPSLGNCMRFFFSLKEIGIRHSLAICLLLFVGLVIVTRLTIQVSVCLVLHILKWVGFHLGRYWSIIYLGCQHSHCSSFFLVCDIFLVDSFVLPLP